MNDTKEISEKISHIDKSIIRIETLLSIQGDKLAEIVQKNSIVLTDHDTRIKDIEKEMGEYRGGIKFLNWLLGIIGSFIIGGLIWIFSEMHTQKSSLELLRSEFLYQKEQIIELDKQLDRLNEKYTQITDKHNQNTNEP